MALENVTCHALVQGRFEFVQQNKLRVRIGLREGRSRRRRGACSDEVLVDLDVAGGADPGIELGWEAGSLYRNLQKPQ